MPKRSDVIGTIKIIATDVYRSLGSGFSESVYDRAIQVGLRLAGLRYETQRIIDIRYKNHHVGIGYPDLVVHAGRQHVVVELKAMGIDAGPAEIQQLKNYMRYLKISRGLLINFQQPERREGKTKLEIKDVKI